MAMDQRKQNKLKDAAVKKITAVLEDLPDTESMEVVVLEIYHRFVLVQNDRYVLAAESS